MSFLDRTERSVAGSSFDDQVRQVSRAARERLVASGAWATEEAAEKEVRFRTRHKPSIAA